MILPVIFSTPSQRPAVERLVKHCHDLDGTELKVFEWGEDPPGANGPPDICLQAFRFTLAASGAGTVCWLEHDSIPLRAGWLNELASEYESQPRKIMLSIDQQTPFDMIGGIGIYDVDATLALLPARMFDRGWDGFLIEEHPDKVHRSEKIQHSYGIYGHGGSVINYHQFPRDLWMVRPSAVIFHKDAKQGLIECTTQR